MAKRNPSAKALDDSKERFRCGAFNDAQNIATQKDLQGKRIAWRL
jgi:hypothetical protein